MKTSVKWLATALALSLVPALTVSAPADSYGDKAPMKMMKQRSNAEMVSEAMMSAPKTVSAGAAIMTMDGKTLREGKNGWVCYPGPAGDRIGAMCVDAVWRKLLQAYMTKGDFQTSEVGIGYMLSGDVGVSNNDPWATAKTPTNQWVTEGPHMMVVVPTAQLAGISTDPDNGGPYVMWSGTPYAHIMIPVGPRMPMMDKKMSGKKMMNKPMTDKPMMDKPMQ